MGEERGEGCQGTCIKDTWTKPNGGMIKSGRWGWLGWRGVVGGKWRQLYLNNNLKKKKKEKKNLKAGTLRAFQAKAHFERRFKGMEM